MNAMKKQDSISLEQYARAQPFLNLLMHSRTLTLSQKLVLRGQALHGDLEGAYSEWRKLTTVDKGDARYE